MRNEKKVAVRQLKEFKKIVNQKKKISEKKKKGKEGEEEKE